MNKVFTAKFLQHLNKKKADNKEKGFTLIELLVVVIIIGVLAAVALPNLLAQVGKAREVEGKTGVGTITRSQQTRHFETGDFETVTDANLADVNQNNLSITVDSKYFNFSSTPDSSSSASVATTAAAPDATTANANGTRAIGSLLTFATGNYQSIMCQTNTVTATTPNITATTSCPGSTTVIK
jgi:type IV pilus assembly protein PilA